MTEYLTPEYIPHGIAWVALIYFAKTRIFAAGSDPEWVKLKSVASLIVVGAVGLWLA